MNIVILIVDEAFVLFIRFAILILIVCGIYDPSKSGKFSVF